MRRSYLSLSALGLAWCWAGFWALAAIAQEAPADPEDSAVSVEQLARQLESGEWEERADAAQALADRGPEAAPVIDALHKALDDPQPDVRGPALLAVAATQAKPEASIERLIEALDDDATTLQLRSVSTYAAEALGQYGPRVLDQMIELLESKRLLQVRGAAIAIAEMGPEGAKAVPHLIRLLEKDHPDTRIHALNALMKIGPAAKPARDALIKALENDDFHTQYWACRALGALGEQAEPAVPKLIELMETGVSSVRRHAAQAIGRIGPAAGERVVEPLRQRVRDPNQVVREDAIVALGKLGQLAASVAPDMEAALEDPFFDAAARSQAAKTLWLLDQDNERPIPVLLRELQSPSAPWVAAEVLGEIGPDAGVVLDVITLLHDPKAETRIYAADALGRMGADAEQALSTLEDLEMKDSDPEVRAAASAAQQAIRQAMHDQP